MCLFMSFYRPLFTSDPNLHLFALLTLVFFSDIFSLFLLMVEQIRTIKKASEARLETMKKEVVVVEAELEEVGIKTLKPTLCVRVYALKPTICMLLCVLKPTICKLQVRYTASLAGVTTNKEYQKQLGEKQVGVRIA
jgi:hypothetical protein